MIHKSYGHQEYYSTSLGSCQITRPIFSSFFPPIHDDLLVTGTYVMGCAALMIRQRDSAPDARARHKTQQRGKFLLTTL